MRQPFKHIENGEKPEVKSRAPSLKPQQNTCVSFAGSTPSYRGTHQPFKAIASSQPRPQLEIQCATISQPQQKPSKSNLHTSIIPPTDPSFTNALWGEVMSATRATKSSEGRSISGRGRGITSPRGGSTFAGSEAGSQRSRTVLAKPSDTDFYKLVLVPRGISIDGTTNTVLASRHFSTSPPTAQRAKYYQEKTGSSASRVWLEIDEEFVKEVVGEYTWMKTHESCEAEFATYGKEVLIRRESRHRSRDERAWMTRRLVEVVTKPKTVDLETPPRNPRPWWSPPLLNPSLPSKPYAYDIRPDCQYWLSLNFANREYKRLYREHVYENDGEAVCPYFTIEFKKDTSTYDTATNQLATAAALALHNRCILKHRYLQYIDNPWSEVVASSIRHYGLTFSGSEYQFWCIKPNVSQQDIKADWTWQGCEMSNISRGKLIGEVEVEDFIEWVNEIHHWGLTVYGKGCEEDVKGCIDYGPSGVRTSSAVALNDFPNLF